MRQPPTHERKGLFKIFAGLLAVLSGCAPVGLNLPAAMARADARTYAACGRHADPTSVHLVRGYIQCGAQANTWGCTWTDTGEVLLSRTVKTQAALEMVATHEYLHLLGAEHIAAGHGIMGVDAGSMIDRVTAEDLAKANCPAPRAE